MITQEVEIQPGNVLSNVLQLLMELNMVKTNFIIDYDNISFAPSLYINNGIMIKQLHWLPIRYRIQFKIMAICSSPINSRTVQPMLA